MAPEPEAGEYSSPVIVLVDARYGFPLWRFWTSPWRIFAGQWYRMAKDAWTGGHPDGRFATPRMVLGPRVEATPIGGRAEP